MLYIIRRVFRSARLTRVRNADTRREASEPPSRESSERFLIEVTSPLGPATSTASATSRMTALFLIMFMRPRSGGGLANTLRISPGS